MLLNCSLEKTLESPLECKEIQPVHSEGDQPWVFFGKNDAKVGTPVLWPPDVKNWLIGKDPDAGKDWRQEAKQTTEDEMVGWHHRLNGHEFDWTPGFGDGQGSLACCSQWGPKELDTTEWLNWTEPLAFTNDSTVIKLCLSLHKHSRAIIKLIQYFFKNPISHEKWIWSFSWKKKM